MQQQVHMNHSDILDAAIEFVRNKHPEFKDKHMTAQMYLSGWNSRLVCKVFIEDVLASNAESKV